MPLLTPEQVAAELGVPVGRIVRAQWRHELPWIKIGRQLRMRPEDLTEYLAKFSAEARASRLRPASPQLPAAGPALHQGLVPVAQGDARRRGSQAKRTRPPSFAHALQFRRVNGELSVVERAEDLPQLPRSTPAPGGGRKPCGQNLDLHRPGRREE